MDNWLGRLKKIVESKPLLIFRFDDDEWSRLRGSQGGGSDFTFARHHDDFDAVGVPTACLLIGKDGLRSEVFFGLARSRRAVTTLQTQMKIERASRINIMNEQSLIQAIKIEAHARRLEKKLRTSSSTIKLSPMLSVHLVEQLAAIKRNRGAMRAAIASLSLPRSYSGAESMQLDAVHTSLRAFGLSPNDRALSLEMSRGTETALAGTNVMEDSVVEHDAREFPRYDLVSSDITGRAVFQRGQETLEIFTANRRPLEKVFGVDLIYVNQHRNNIVMLQYKMLEPVRSGQTSDWVYRPDKNLDKEIRRMKRFSRKHELGKYEYRLNSQVFYLKFVKRDAVIGKGAVHIPLDHFERIMADPSSQGPRGGLRVSFESLDGRYMRQSSFLDLVSGGYIGASATTASHLKRLIKTIINGNRAVVAAIQSYDGS